MVNCIFKNDLCKTLLLYYEGRQKGLAHQTNKLLIIIVWMLILTRGVAKKVDELSMHTSFMLLPSQTDTCRLVSGNSMKTYMHDSLFIPLYGQRN